MSERRRGLIYIQDYYDIFHDVHAGSFFYMKLVQIAAYTQNLDKWIITTASEKKRDFLKNNPHEPFIGVSFDGSEGDSSIVVKVTSNNIDLPPPTDSGWQILLDSKETTSDGVLRYLITLIKSLAAEPVIRDIETKTA